MILRCGTNMTIESVEESKFTPLEIAYGADEEWTSPYIAQEDVPTLMIITGVFFFALFSWIGYRVVKHLKKKSSSDKRSSTNAEIPVEFTDIDLP